MYHCFLKILSCTSVLNIDKKINKWNILKDHLTLMNVIMADTNLALSSQEPITFPDQFCDNNSY